MATRQKKRRSRLDVKAIRIDAGMTQVEMAAKLGVCQATITHWELGRRVPSGPATILLKQLADSRR